MTRQRLIKIAIAAAVLVTVAVVCVLLSFAFAFNQEAALCAYLDGCGISDEDLCDLIDDLVASKDALDEDDEVSERGIDALWNAVSAVSSRGGQFVEAARAYENAPAAGNPFIMLKYRSTAQRLAQSLKNGADLVIYEASQSTAQIVAACDGIVLSGRGAFDSAADTLREIATADDIGEEVAYRDIIETILYSVQVTADVDFARLYILDGLTYRGFCEANSTGISSAAAALRAMTYDDLLQAFGYLPQRADFASAMCAFAQSNGADTDAVGDLIADLLNAAYAARGIDARAVGCDVGTALTTLASAFGDDRPEASEAAEGAASFMAALFDPLFLRSKSCAMLFLPPC